MASGVVGYNTGPVPQTAPYPSNMFPAGSFFGRATPWLTPAQQTSATSPQASPAAAGTSNPQTTAIIVVVAILAGYALFHWHYTR